MEFSANHPILFLMVGIIIAVVLAQSVYFLVKALRRARAIGMDMGKIKKIILSAAIFTIAPAVAIVIAVISLSQSLGLALPWLRLSVIGSLSYEAVAAANAASGMGVTLADLTGNMTASAYVTIVIVMTVSILVGIWLAPIIAPKIQGGMVNFGKKDKKWMELLQNALFIGMISAFVGFVFCDLSLLWTEGSTAGLIPVLVMVVAALVMAVCGLLMKTLKWKWLNDYALPLSMVLGMLSAIPLTTLLGG